MMQKQAEAVARLLANWDKPTSISFIHNPFDLPPGYVAFTLSKESGVVLYGGISPEGDIST